MEKEKWNSCKVCGSEVQYINKYFDLVECTSCGLIFCRSIYSLEEFKEVYDTLYNKTDRYIKHQNEFLKLKSGQKVALGHNREKLIGLLLRLKKNVICEIGAGIGLVGAYLKKSQVEYIGIEIDDESARKAQSLGLNVIQGSFEVLSDYINEFDTIFATEVIEHLQDLGLFF